MSCRTALFEPIGSLGAAIFCFGQLGRTIWVLGEGLGATYTKPIRAMVGLRPSSEVTATSPRRPRYINTSLFDFHLNERSGNVDMAPDSADTFFDMDRNERPQGGMNDIGAYER